MCEARVATAAEVVSREAVGSGVAVLAEAATAGVVQVAADMVVYTVAVVAAAVCQQA